MIALESEYGTATLRPIGQQRAKINPPRLGPASPMPTHQRPRLLLASGLRRALAIVRERQWATMDYLEAVGATDLELARLSLSPGRLTNSVRDTNTRLCNLTLVRYR